MIYRLNIDQIVVTKNYQTVPVPEDLDHMSINDEDQYIQEANEVLQPSLLTSLQSKFLQSSLPESLQNKFLRLSLPVSLRYGFLQLCLIASLQHGFIQLSLLVSLQSMHIHSSTTMPLWNLFLQCLYGDVSTIICIQVKPEIHSYRYSHLYKDISTATPIQTKPEVSKSWTSSR